mmetsp:Transcript_16800/g.36434  ORF Transcript_16800/g.36434 Transcript_16800/m.36434 type:complete len:132 (-) Transcript_16800:270-665(-)|eukprot:CAMPEP_0172550404 /NCGR_PEP_ID=MMETSP1067-20121228/29539_1 /TAXON_ID=265564 ORGANISM="Thalassiosira punctigera, Strain Tpunct2005C2" /NCGR_SAMPLE_ID=MMETSP1067 /ASSEMBLY_ACC=CAM_ASM_000444 /LENGTH=131 /DNA_ID=CAMNT_0013337983 /DNA_START=172 /DNA_END=567 /DNA_ORIENTATION=+
MNRLVSLLLIVVALAASSVQGFAPSSLGGVSGGSNFVVSQRPRASTRPVTRSNSRTSLQMGSQAKFGVFSPAVYAAKITLGNDKLNKIRGKGISLHSQAIGEFCTWAGAYHLRTRLIKKAKTNGDILGFLV